MKKILIISYHLPPDPDIGGRRWAKFAKCLYRRGYDVKVIAAQVPYSKNSNWCKDIEKLKKDNRITYLPSGYPQAMHRTKTVIDKILYRVTLYYMRATREGYYYDPSIGWERYLLPEIEMHIKKGYKNIIATGAPFRYLATLPSLKERYSDIKLIADMRDPWTNNKLSYGYSILTPKRLHFEQKAERSVVEKFDYIISVNDEMSQYFSTLLPDNKKKFITISNGFDSEDMKQSIDIAKNKDSKIRFVYIGTLYFKLATIFKDFIDTLNDIELSSNSLYKRLLFEFYGYANSYFIDISHQHNNIVKFYGQVSLDRVSTALHQADATIIFLTPEMDYYFNTKMYDCIQMRKPMILFAKGGKTADLIEKHNLGIVIRDIKKDLPKAISKIANGYSINREFDISQFDISNLIDKIIKLL